MPLCEIQTPEMISFHYQTAGLATRSLAWLLDELFIYGFLIGCYLLFSAAGPLATALIILIYFVLSLGYFAIFEFFWTGRTPGKKIFGIRVISARGGRLGFHEVAIRNLLRAIDGLPINMLLGGIVAFIDPQRRRLGDLAAQTLVIREGRQALPTLMAAQKTRVNSFRRDAALRGRVMNRLTRPERDMLFDLAMRRDQLAPADREALFGEAAKHFQKRFALPETDTFLSDEQAVLNLALLVQEEKFTL